MLPRKTTRLECPIGHVSRRLGCVAFSEEWGGGRTESLGTRAHTRAASSARGIRHLQQHLLFSGLGFLTFWLQFMLAARLTEVSRSVSL